MTFEEKFQEIKREIPKSKKTFDFEFAVQINMTDEDCHGTFYAAYRDGHFEVEPYDYRDRSALITAHSAVLMDVLKGKETPKAAYDGKSLLIEGDLQAVKELSKVCKKKRETAKKAEKVTSRAEKAADIKAKSETKKSTGKRAAILGRSDSKTVGAMAKAKESKKGIQS